MGAIVGADGLSVGDIVRAVESGSRFVVYRLCVSPVVSTFTSSSAIYLLRPRRNRWGTALLFSLASILVGLWAIPWGPIRTTEAVIDNLSGGKNVTGAVMEILGTLPETTIISAGAPAIADLSRKIA